MFEEQTLFGLVGIGKCFQDQLIILLYPGSNCDSGVLRSVQINLIVDNGQVQLRVKKHF